MDNSRVSFLIEKIGQLLEQEIKKFLYNRKISDPIFIILFGILIAFCTTIFTKLFQKGNYDLFFIPTDYSGYKCGMDSLINSTFLYFQISRTIGSKNILNEIKHYCIKKCPDISEIPVSYTSSNIQFIPYPTIENNKFCLMNIDLIEEKRLNNLKVNYQNVSIRDIKTNVDSNKIDPIIFEIDYRKINNLIKEKIINKISLVERIYSFLISSKNFIRFLIIPFGYMLLFNILVRIRIQFATWFLIIFLISAIGLKGYILFSSSLDSENDFWSENSFSLSMMWWSIDIIFFFFLLYFKDTISHFNQFFGKVSELLGFTRLVILPLIFFIINIGIFMIYIKLLIYNYSIGDDSDFYVNYSNYLLPQSQNILTLISFLQSIWIIVFLDGYFQYMLSFVTSLTFFFGPGKLRNTSILGLFLGIRSNFGSLMIGSIFYTFFFIFRIISVPLRILVSIFSICDCLKSFFLTCCEFLNLCSKCICKLSFMVLGIEGCSYCDSYSLILRKLQIKGNLSMILVNSITSFKIYMTFSMAFLSMMTMDILNDYFNFFNNSLENFKVTLGIGFAISWITIYYFFNVYEIIYDTIIYCLMVHPPNEKFEKSESLRKRRIDILFVQEIIVKRKID